MARFWHLKERTRPSRKPKAKPSTLTNSNARQQGTKRRRELTAAEQEIVGSQFEDDAIEWVVLKVEWDESVDEIMAYYYDKEAVEASDVDVDMLNDDSDEIERTRVL